MKRRITSDRKRARSLLKMAKISLERLNSFDKLKYPSNTLDDYYDIIHQLMEAISLGKGVKFIGDYSHKELIDWVSNELKFSSSEKEFIQSLRNYRNKISYEGFFVKPDFIKRNDRKINNAIKMLKLYLEDLI